MEKERLLLHACCANCLMYPYQALKDDFAIDVFFYNPNIHPYSEYKKRLYEVEKVCKAKEIPLTVGPYEDDEWFKLTDRLKHEPEGGKRCSVCFEIRLEKTAGTATEKGIGIVSTTLTVSPHKNSRVISQIGRKVSGHRKIEYMDRDFKKKDGYKKTLVLSEKMNIYRQNYCGCIYSLRQR